MKLKCPVGGTTYCFFLDMAAQEGKKICTASRCKLPTPPSWLAREAKRKKGKNRG